MKTPSIRHDAEAKRLGIGLVYGKQTRRKRSALLDWALLLNSGKNNFTALHFPHKKAGKKFKLDYKMIFILETAGENKIEIGRSFEMYVTLS